MVMFMNYHSFSNEQISELRNFISQNTQNIDLVTSRLLLAMNFKSNLCAVTYLRQAIVYCYKLPEGAKISFSKEVFPYIAQKYSSTVKCVDRDIRTAIKTCYESGNLFAVNGLCKCNFVDRSYVPTNSEFIMNLVTWLRTVTNDKEISA